MSDAMAELVQALDDVLDVDAGLADALLPNTHRGVVTALSDVLDVDAGLEQIQPTIPKIVRATALATFADQFAYAAPEERLAARAWLPHNAIEEIQTIAKSSRWLDFGEDLERAYAASLRDAHDEWQEAIDLATIKAGRCARSLAHFPKTAQPPRPMIDEIRIKLRRLPMSVMVPSATHEILEAFRRVREYQVEMRAGAVLAAVTAVVDVPAARGFLLALASDSPGLAIDEDAILETVDAIQLLKTATTDFAAADLSETDLRGIPLNGLRWSTTTKWPSEWADQIRVNSIAVGKGLYEIRFGTVHDDVAFVQ